MAPPVCHGDDRGAPPREGAGQYTEPVSGDSYEALVAGMSRLLGALARDVAKDVVAAGHSPPRP